MLFSIWRRSSRFPILAMMTLRRFGRAVQKKCSPEANRGKTPGEELAIQLEEAWMEWKRRFTGSPTMMTDRKDQKMGS